MLQEFPTIYRAKNLQQAQLLCNRLEEEGIRATITNSVLENGSGVDIVGWPTLSRVMVAWQDAVRAREIASDFDREGYGGSGGWSERHRNSEQAPPEAEIVVAWPCCPACGARRMTRCVFCGTSGTDFPPADANPGDLLGLPTLPAEALSCCSCGPGGCGSGTHRNEAEHPAAGANGTEEQADDASPAEFTSAPLLLCPTCDEPFHPQYLQHCEWCGHEFADGVENPIPEERVQEPFNWRIAYAIYVLALLAVGFAVYMMLLF